MNNQISFMDETETQFVHRMLPICLLYYAFDTGGRYISPDDIVYLYTTEEGFEMEVEYNESCRCHPEYMTDQFNVPWEWINKYNLNPEQTELELETLIEEQKDRQKKAAEAKADKEKREREKRIEEGERKLLAELKLKYEGV